MHLQIIGLSSSCGVCMTPEVRAGPEGFSKEEFQKYVFGGNRTRPLILGALAARATVDAGGTFTQQQIYEDLIERNRRVSRSVISREFSSLSQVGLVKIDEHANMLKGRYSVSDSRFWLAFSNLQTTLDNMFGFEATKSNEQA
jgi:hypothetical protein